MRLARAGGRANRPRVLLAFALIGVTIPLTAAPESPAAQSGTATAQA